MLPVTFFFLFLPHFPHNGKQRTYNREEFNTSKDGQEGGITRVEVPVAR